ncbi:MAG: hypothetical protein JKY56_00020 [Kofleriaceae bacterium]|nr:hypothetical protein [Kofleriaceae bacterium]
MSGCLSKPAAESQGMCEVSTDCPSLDHLCDQGVCWGDPPDSSGFAAVLIPPADRPDLAPTELTQIAISSDGTIASLDFGRTVTFHGRIELGCGAQTMPPDPESGQEGCQPGTLIPAQVVIERASDFPGGPQYRRTILTNAEVNAEEDSFSIALPNDGAEYRVTVLPDEISLEAIASGGRQIQAPPFSALIRTDDDVDVLWEIGSPDQLKVIEGCIANSNGDGKAYASMRVTAFGHWTSFSKSTRASSVVPTDIDGCFSLAVPIDMQDEFDIVAKPGPGQTLPTIRLFDEYVRDPNIDDGSQEAYRIAPLLMPTMASPSEFHLPLRGRTGGGELEPIIGATVVLDTVFETPATEKRNVQVSFSAQAVSSSDPDLSGIAVVKLYAGDKVGSREYRVRVFPTSDAQHASIFDGVVSLGPGGPAVLDTVELGRRTPVSGVITNTLGQPLANTPLKFEPSQLLRGELTTPAERVILDNLQFASELTGETGEFLVWLDPTLLGLFARYDIALAPPDFSSAPRWVFSGVSVDAEPGEAVNLGELTLPPASYVRGTIRDSRGLVVPGAEIRWFRLPDDATCGDLPKAPSCEAPALPIGIWESDEAGEVIAVLPDPLD